MFEIALPPGSVAQANLSYILVQWAPDTLYQTCQCGYMYLFSEKLIELLKSLKLWAAFQAISFSVLKYNVRNCLTAGIRYTGEFCPV